MADTYASFRELARHERAGIDYRIVARGALPSVIVVAAHGASSRAPLKWPMPRRPKRSAFAPSKASSRQADGPLVFTGGLHHPLRRRIETALRARGFDVRRHTDPNLQGLDPRNLCNRGQTGRGVQLELSHALRLQMFESLSRQGRQRPRPKFRAFVSALRTVLLT
jgi:phage replication-related protein YjqB (UPF0714/DUF867 family)